MSRLTRMREQLRQLRYPPEFRIPVSITPGPVRDAVAVAVRDAIPVDPVPSATELADDVVADLATSLWRTRKKMDPDGAREAPPAQRAAARHLLTAWETLEEAGVEIQDHDGALFRPGMALDVVGFEKTPGVRATMVLETVRPSVYRSGRCIQTGQVIVAQPEEGLGNGARNH